MAGSKAKAKKNTSNKSPQTASRTLSQMRKTKSHAREESVKDYNGEASGTPARDVSDDSHNDEEFHSDPNALDGLVGDLKEIWVDKKEQGVKRIRRQRKKYDLEIRNESSKLLVRRCRDLADDLKSPTKTSTKPTESEGKRLCETIASLGNDVYHFNLEKKDETRNHLFQDLYAYIFPRLLHTLCRIVNFYVQSFSQDTSQATIPALHLQTIVDFTAAIVKLGERARSSKVKVDSALFIEPLDIEWDDEECLALMESLAKYAKRGYKNPRYTIYCKIIRNHCGPQGILRRFNVTEIVMKSKHIKQMLQDREWAQLIPTF
ncbi:guanine nucleotide-binding 3-like [Botryosphaeria dothidea]|uniref:Guanine nucleotide-binding 3-like n=1 Tax=Botryosphaeria dothidea TaxID=55169 RepID=A0A8H4J3S2_9PEZI|nr:guanine nucleotide-binding 3-like [Botryosphaeria dothidea]